MESQRTVPGSAPGAQPQRSILANRWLLAALAVIAAFQLATIRPGLFGDEDAALYLLHARNFVSGRPYAATGYIYSAENRKYSPAVYPPVFPILIAPLFRWSGLHLTAYKICLSLMFVLCLFVIALLYRRRLAPPYLLLLVILLGLNPYLTDQKNQITSDLPFLLFVYTALLFFADASEPGPELFSWLPRALWAGFFSYLAFGTRAIGIGLIPCVIAFSLIRHRKVTRPVLAATALFAVLALLQSLAFPASSDYLRQASLGIRPLQNLHFYAGSIAALWDAGIGALPRLLLAGMVTVFAFLGFWKQCSKELDLPTFFSLGYGAFLILWPLAQAIYLLPIVPVYFYFFALGLWEFRDFAATRWRLPKLEFASAMLVLLLFVYVIKYAKSRSGPDPNAFDSPAAMQVYAFFRDSTPESAIVISSTPRAVALYADRSGAVFPQSPDASQLSKLIFEIGANYLLISPSNSGELAALCRSLSAPVPVFSNSGYTVYKTRTNR